MRTVEEIADYYAQQAADDLLGFTADVLLPYLPFDQARPWLKADATADAWGAPQPLTREHILAEMAEYLEFAWEKAGNHRGISALRSVEKMQAWLWLLGDAKTLAYAAEPRHYPMYGAPILLQIAKAYALPIPTDPGLQRMMRGQPCSPKCDEGCR